MLTGLAQIKPIGATNEECSNKIKSPYYKGYNNREGYSIYTLISNIELLYLILGMGLKGQKKKRKCLINPTPKIK